jgi:hypothetical protein
MMKISKVHLQKMIHRLESIQRQKAQALVEFMLVLPILLLIIYGTVEVARLVFIYSSVTNASRQAARYGSTSGESLNGVPRFQDCEGIRDAANQSAIITDFDEIKITYDRGVAEDGTQIPISGIDPDPDSDSCPIEENNVRNGDRIIVQVSATYEPIVPIVPLDPLEIISTSARTFLISIPILGSAMPTAFYAETATPSRTVSPTITTTYTPTLFLTLTPSRTVPPDYTPPSPLPPTLTYTPSNTPLPTKSPTITPTPISCTGLTGVSHGLLKIKDDYMEMEIYNKTGYILSTAQVYVEWNHDTGHFPGIDPTLHLIQASLADSVWNGDLFAPSAYFPGYYPLVPQGYSRIRFTFQQPYYNQDGTERIIITLSTPGCVNYPIDSRN